MRLLLDTHVLLWWMLNDGRLAPSALALLRDPLNLLYLSSVSGFEIASKVAIGKMRLTSTPASFVTSGLRQGRIDELPLLLRHTYRVAGLPLLHRDPFDRLLIAVAIEEGLTLLTDDQHIRAYPVSTIW